MTVGPYREAAPGSAITVVKDDLAADIERIMGLNPADRGFVVRELAHREGLWRSSSGQLALPAGSATLHTCSFMGPSNCYWQPLWLCLEEIPAFRNEDDYETETKRLCLALPRAPYVCGFQLHSSGRLFEVGPPVASPLQEGVWWYRLSHKDTLIGGIGGPFDGCQVSAAGWQQPAAVLLTVHVEWLEVAKSERQTP